MSSRPPGSAPAVSVTYATTRRVTLPSTLLSPVHSEDEDEDPLEILGRPKSTTGKPTTKRRRVYEYTSEDEWREWSQDLKRRLGDSFDCESKSTARECPQGMRFIPLREEKRAEYEALEDQLRLVENKRKKRVSTE